MRIILLTTLILSCASFFAGFASAQTTKPPELAPYIHASQPYGQGGLTKLWIHAYDATLWTDAAQWSMNEPFALSLRYGTNFSSSSLTSRSIDEMQENEPLTEAQAASYGKQLAAIFPDVRDKDVITAIYLPKKGALFFHNGKPAGKIEDDEFAQRFMNIWLSPKTSEPQLRKQLLAQAQ